MRKYGGFIPGIRPGKRTAQYIDDVLTKLTLVGSLYLASVAILPVFLISGFKVAPIPLIGPWLDTMLPLWVTEGLGGINMPLTDVKTDGICRFQF